MIKSKTSNNEDYFYSKPLVEEIKDGTQLFSKDIKINSGSKMFLIKSYDEMYQIINNDKYKCYYEDHTYNNKIKLHIDTGRVFKFT